MKTKKTKDDVIKELWTSKNVCEIADIVEMSETSVRRHAKKMGLPKKSEQVKTDEVTPEELSEKILQHLIKSKKRHTIEELLDKFDVGIKKIKNALAE